MLQVSSLNEGLAVPLLENQPGYQLQPNAKNERHNPRTQGGEKAGEDTAGKQPHKEGGKGLPEAASLI